MSDCQSYDLSPAPLHPVSFDLNAPIEESLFYQPPPHIIVTPPAPSDTPMPILSRCKGKGKARAYPPHHPIPIRPLPPVPKVSPLPSYVPKSPETPWWVIAQQNKSAEERKEELTLEEAMTQLQKETLLVSKRSQEFLSHKQRMQEWQQRQVEEEEQKSQEPVDVQAQQAKSLGLVHMWSAVVKQVWSFFGI